MAYQLMISRNVFETFFLIHGLSATGFNTHPVIELSTEAFKNVLFELHAIKNELKLGLLTIVILVKLEEPSGIGTDKSGG